MYSVHFVWHARDDDLRLRCVCDDLRLRQFYYCSERNVDDATSSFDREYGKDRRCIR